MNIISLTKWSQLKGTHVVGTGDFTHPAWFSELSETLEPAEPGLYRLKPTHEKEIAKDVPELCRNPMRFMLTVEISSIYKKRNRVYKIHSLVFAPSLAVSQKINASLSRIGNLKSDGRPILGLDAKELLKIVLDASPDAMLVPAHAWTPHFSVFGSESGFDTLEDCFEELTPYIFAIETGLSSDPPMNWRLSQLDRVALISNSDAHSPRKLGREANMFNTDLSYFAITDALKKNDFTKFEKTIEFFPEEGKYHLDGHRACGVSLSPEETKQHNFLCPSCGKRVTVGVLHRVSKLADRKEGERPKGARPYVNIIPLLEIIAETEHVGTGSKRVEEIYGNLIRELGNEFFILLDCPIERIASIFPYIGEAIKRMREGKISISPGYDGEFGTVHIFDDKESASFTPQESLF